MCRSIDEGMNITCVFASFFQQWLFVRGWAQEEFQVCCMSSLSYTCIWEQKSIEGSPPPGLANTARVGTSLYSFRGSDGKHHSSILLQLDLHTLKWKELVASSPSVGPQGKTGCRMVSYGDNPLVSLQEKEIVGPAMTYVSSI